MTQPTKGIEAWKARREAWRRPNSNYNEEQQRRRLEMSVFKELISSEARKQAVYKYLVYEPHEFKQPFPLKYVIPILVAGWQEDGLWPKGMVVDRSS
ncbi:hypothetical protein BDB01DRAFT_846522 [Pilobolus umbonatus]|nr:hypothetical protein BDB01DRAFT_846522 [Pilobolus umbonatus]